MKSKFIWRLSIRLWHRLSLKLLHGFLSNFSCGFPWAIGPYVFFFFFFFFIFEKKKSFGCFYKYFPLTWDPKGAKFSKRYIPSYKSQPKVFTLFPNFLPNGPHETGIFEILTKFIIRFR